MKQCYTDTMNLTHKDRFSKWLTMRTNRMIMSDFYDLNNIQKIIDSMGLTDGVDYIFLKNKEIRFATKEDMALFKLSIT